MTPSHAEPLGGRHVVSVRAAQGRSGRYDMASTNASVRGAFVAHCSSTTRRGGKKVLMDKRSFFVLARRILAGADDALLSRIYHKARKLGSRRLTFATFLDALRMLAMATLRAAPASLRRLHREDGTAVTTGDEAEVVLRTRLAQLSPLKLVHERIATGAPGTNSAHRTNALTPQRLWQARGREAATAAPPPVRASGSVLRASATAAAVAFEASMAADVAVAEAIGFTSFVSSSTSRAADKEQEQHAAAYPSESSPARNAARTLALARAVAAAAEEEANAEREARLWDTAAWEEARRELCAEIEHLKRERNDAAHTITTLRFKLSECAAALQVSTSSAAASSISMETEANVETEVLHHHHDDNGAETLIALRHELSNGAAQRATAEARIATLAQEESDAVRTANALRRELSERTAFEAELRLRVESLSEELADSAAHRKVTEDVVTALRDELAASVTERAEVESTAARVEAGAAQLLDSLSTERALRVQQQREMEEEARARALDETSAADAEALLVYQRRLEVVETEYAMERELRVQLQREMEVRASASTSTTEDASLDLRRRLEAAEAECATEQKLRVRLQRGMEELMDTRRAAAAAASSTREEDLLVALLSSQRRRDEIAEPRVLAPRENETRAAVPTTIVRTPPSLGPRQESRSNGAWMRAMCQGKNPVRPTLASTGWATYTLTPLA